MESCSTISSAKENNNCIYRTKNGYQAFILLVGHSPRDLGSFATHAAATEAYVSRLRHQIPTVIDLSRNDDECDLPGYSQTSHHSKSSAYGSNEEPHGDSTQRNTKRSCTTAAKDTLAQDLGQLTDDVGSLKLRRSSIIFGPEKDPYGLLDHAGFTSEPSTSCASLNKLNYGAVTPPRNMCKNQVVTERVYSSRDGFPGTKARTGAGLLRNRPICERFLPPKKRRMRLYEKDQYEESIRSSQEKSSLPLITAQRRMKTRQ